MNKDLLIKEEIEKFKRDFPKSFHQRDLLKFLESSLSKIYEDVRKEGAGETPRQTHCSKCNKELTEYSPLGICDKCIEVNVKEVV